MEFIGRQALIAFQEETQSDRMILHPFLTLSIEQSMIARHTSESPCRKTFVPYIQSGCLDSDLRVDPARDTSSTTETCEDHWAIECSRRVGGVVCSRRVGGVFTSRWTDVTSLASLRCAHDMYQISDILSFHVLLETYGEYIVSFLQGSSGRAGKQFAV